MKSVTSTWRDYRITLGCALLLMTCCDAREIEISAEQLRDQIRGGLLGQILGNLNGLEHEMKYIQEPGNVQAYVPALPEGACTDDDTDFEWVYIVAMQKENTVLLSPERIAHLWTQRINRRIWCSNQYARQLMDLGLLPPLTGSVALNPWAEFNISGQFLCETFGLLAPGMPQTAARIGLNYTRVAIDGEPAQTTQLFTSMIATAFITQDMNVVLDAGMASIDPGSEIREIVQHVRQWHRQHPENWQQTRRLLKETYATHGGEAMRDKNGYELNTGSIIAALLYGQGDVAETLRCAFNFGWDADCNAATAGTVVGVMRGYRAMLAQGWQIVDRYHNTTRGNMPNDETITSFADRIVDLAEIVICENGGQRSRKDGRPMYSVPIQEPRNVQRLESVEAQTVALRSRLQEEIERGVLQPETRREQARAAYLAICLNLAGRLAQRHNQPWQRAVATLRDAYPQIPQVLFHHSGVPLAEPLRNRALAAGLPRPAKKVPLWH